MLASRLKIALNISVILTFFLLTMLPQISTAAIPVGNDDRLSFYGDALFRYDSDTRNHPANKERNQYGIQTHLGTDIKLDASWMIGMRMGTMANSINPAPRTLGSGTNANNSDNADFGLDKAFIQYFHKKLKFWAGKNSMNLFQQNDVFWDRDINPEGLATSYESMPLTVNFGYFILNENGWKPASDKNDDTMFMLQGVYKGYIGNLFITVGIASALLDDKVSNGNPGSNGTDVLIPAPGSTTNAQGVATVDSETPGVDFGTLSADQNYALSLEMGIPNWSAGLDVFSSNAETEKLGYVVQGKFRFEDVPLGFRAGYYHIEAGSMIANGLYTQDNFPSKVNFDGYRVQVDYYLSDAVTLDLRFYQANKIKNLNPPAGSVSNTIMTSNYHNRLQLNLKATF